MNNEKSKLMLASAKVFSLCVEAREAVILLMDMTAEKGTGKQSMLYSRALTIDHAIAYDVRDVELLNQFD